MSPRPEPNAARPLAGLRVFEVGRFIALPTAGLALAQLGADVVRLDPPGGADDTRRAPRGPSGESLYWAGLNHAKRSVVVDLSSPEGETLVEEMLDAAAPHAVVLTNDRRYRFLDADTVCGRHPSLIHVHLQGHPDGAPAVDYTVNAASGFAEITGHHDARGPVNQALPAWDLLAGMWIAFSVVSADRLRRTTGAGGAYTVALSDVTRSVAANLGQLADAEVNGTVRPRAGNTVYGAFGDAFATADERHVMVVGITDPRWRRIVEVTGTADAVAALGVAHGADLAEGTERYRLRAELFPVFAPWFAARPLADVTRALDAAGVLWAPFRSFTQVLAEDPACTHPETGVLRRVRGRDGEWFLAEPPVRGAALASSVDANSPRLAGDTRAVLRELLGLDDAAVDDLIGRGVVQEHDSEDRPAD
jgi:2-methylfumaryl-CoA isomerase